MDIAEALIKTGLTGQEAQLYLALCRQGSLTGYEAAKASGVSRSNAYLALSGLVEKGGAWKVEGEPVAYLPVPPPEYLAKVRRSFDEILALLESGLPGPADAPAPFITVSGREAVIAKARFLIDNAALRLYLSLAAPELAALKDELGRACGRGIKTVIITDGDFNLEGAIVHRRGKKPDQLRLIVDGEQVLAGTLSGAEAGCVFSRNAALVQLIKDSLINELELIRLSAGDSALAGAGKKD